ncbi:MAG: alpha/beta hydrolase [Sinobacteraceae bacterium]|nr:alpha/beta hydrolase [Nevskiaceae bacterium]
MSETVWQELSLRRPGGLQLYARRYPRRRGGAVTNDRVPVVCIPGLTRNCRDFESLALHLSATREVLTPDLRGRGRSDHDPDWRNYRLDVYVSDIVAWLDFLQLSRVVIVGTSLGGLVGMFIGAEHRARLAGLVMNDIGPQFSPVGMMRIASSVGTAAVVSRWEQAEADTRSGYAHVMPDFTSEQWQSFTRQIYHEEAPGRIVRDMDPLLGKALRDTSMPVPDFWGAFAALEGLPLLVLRGELSDLLDDTTLERMRAMLPQLQRVTIPQRGHTPTLDEPESRRALDEFLLTC